MSCPGWKTGEWLKGITDNRPAYWRINGWVEGWMTDGWLADWRIDGWLAD
jgi:hypothetical protein